MGFTAHRQSGNIKKDLTALIGAIALGVGVKVWLLLAGVVPFNGDEAVVALMARHILHGERPIFFYGQAYMGSLDAWLVAGAFRLSGDAVMSIRIVQVVLFAMYLVSVWMLARKFFQSGRTAGLAVWIAALPPVLVSTYTTASLGGYAESILLGNVILLIGYEVIYDAWERKPWAWLALGLVGGLAFWTLGMAGVYLLPVALLGIWKHRQKQILSYSIALAGFLAGSLPWWIENITHSGAAFTALVTSDIASLTPLQRLVGLLVLGLPALLGLRFPWSPQLEPAPLLLGWLVIYFGSISYMVRGIRRKEVQMAPGSAALLTAFTLTFIAVFLGTHFGKDPTGRYFLPLFLPLLLCVAALANYLWDRLGWYAGIGLVVILLFLNGVDTYRAAILPDGLTTQFDPITSFDNRYDGQLITFLKQNGETRGYTNYWVSYRLAYLSDESLIYVARLPYKEDLSYTPLDNRYPQYAEMVSQSQRTAYITTKHPKLDDLLRVSFSQNGIAFKEKQIGYFHVFYGLSRKISPDELGLSFKKP